MILNELFACKNAPSVLTGQRTKCAKERRNQDVIEQQVASRLATSANSCLGFRLLDPSWVSKVRVTFNKNSKMGLSS